MPSKEEILVKFRDPDRYHVSYIFNWAVNQLANGTDIYTVLEEVIKMHDSYTEELLVTIEKMKTEPVYTALKEGEFKSEEPNNKQVDVEHYVRWLIKNEVESEWLIKQILLEVANKNGCRHSLDMLEEIGMKSEGRRIPKYDLSTIILTLRENNCFVEYKDFILKELFYSKYKENYEHQEY